jgi:hypothetical protein
LITEYIVIRNNSIIRDGKIIFSAHGRFEEFLLQAYIGFNVDYPKFYKMDVQSKAGFLAAELLLRKYPLMDRYTGAEIGLVLSNSSGSLDTDRKYLESAKTIGSPALFVYTLPNIVGGEICIRHKIKGENTFFVAAEFDPDLLSEYASMLLTTTSTKACLMGWIEVLDEQHDVFLYLTEKNRTGSVEEMAGQALAFYENPLWNN